MRILRKLILLAMILLFVGFFACQELKNESQRPETKLKVLTTIAPLYCFAMNITGDAADVENLLPSGVGPHEYSFTPEDVRRITAAQVLIKNGIGLERWLDKLIAMSLPMNIREPQQKSKPDKKNLIVVDTSQGIRVIDADPHIWLSPRNAVVQVKNIRDALVEADPDNSERYTKNAEKYLKRLEILNREIEDEIKIWKRREFVAFHSAFLYFARDYGLKQAAVIQEFHEKQPTPKDIADVINTIKVTGIKAIFSEPQFSHKIVKAIAQDLKLQVYSLDTLETGALHPEWYEDKMRENLAVLKKALSGESNNSPQSTQRK